MSGDGSRISEFVRLTEPHHRHLFGIAVALCHDRDQAADLVQEALVRAFEAFEGFRPDAPVLPWLRRILRNVFLDSLKTGRARHELAESVLGESSPTLELRDSGPDPFVRLERAQLASWLGEEIAALSPEHREAVMLCVIQELSFEEAAELSGNPVGTVASRLARARAQLRDRMLRRAAAGRAVLADSADALARSTSSDPISKEAERGAAPQPEKSRR